MKDIANFVGVWLDMAKHPPLPRESSHKEYDSLKGKWDSSFFIPGTIYWNLLNLDYVKGTVFTLD
jgi:hypothetical protein